jgi:ATP-dependent Clp protease ATP-binding subunit ClpA
MGRSRYVDVGIKHIGGSTRIKKLTPSQRDSFYKNSKIADFIGNDAFERYQYSIIGRLAPGVSLGGFDSVMVLTEAPVRDELYAACVAINPAIEFSSMRERLRFAITEYMPAHSVTAIDAVAVGKALRERIIEQREGIGGVCATLERYQAGLIDTKVPPNFFFLGPSGVGKTLLATTVGNTLGRVTRRINCGDYQQDHELARLLGAPPGYVGYEDNGVRRKGIIIDLVEENPNAVIIWDEIEKAHPALHNMLLLFMEKGIVEDSDGEQYQLDGGMNFFTSNVGNRSGMGDGIGFAGRTKHKVQEEYRDDELRRQFPSEFLGRVSRIVPFMHLSQAGLSEVVRLEFEKVGRLARLTHDLTLDLSSGAVQAIVEQGTSEDYGARRITNVITEGVTEPLSAAINRGRVVESSEVRIEYDDGFIFRTGSCSFRFIDNELEVGPN